MEKSFKNTSMITTFKLYLFPTLVTILAMLIWRDVSELRGDVKSLLAQSNVDKTNIEQLQRDNRILEQAVFNKKLTSCNYDNTSLIQYDKFFKHEEFFDTKKYITNESNKL